MASATPSREASEGHAGKVGTYRRNGKLQSCVGGRRIDATCSELTF